MHTPLLAVKVYVVVVVGQTFGVRVFALVIFVVGDQTNAGILLLKLIVQFTIFPVIKAASSLTTSCQVPLAVHPFKAVNACSG
jgi:hypothetical protein